MKGAALYVRVSTDAQFEEGYSVDVQKELLSAYCVAKEIKEYAYYVDGGFSGSTLERPEMRRLIDDIRARRIDRVIVYKLDRLSRSQKDTLYLIEDVFNAYGVGFSSLNENFDTTTPVGKAMLGMMSVFAQLERETIRERTRMGMAARVREGFWPGGGHPPLGYDYDRETGSLVPNADAERVRQCFRLYVSGRSTDAIAELLGFPYELTVRNLLARPTYTGKIEYNGTLYEGKHEALVSDALFEQAKRETQRRAGNRSRAAGYLLSGLLVCGGCGAKMRYQRWGKAGVKLVCYSQQTSKKYLIRDEDCSAPRVWAVDVEEAVVSLLRSRAVRHAGAEEDAPDPERALLEDRLRAESTRLSRLYTLYAEGDDTLERLIGEKKKIVAELKARLASTQAADESARRTRVEAEKMTDILSAWDHLTGEEQKAALRACIERVTVFGESVQVDFRI